MFSEKQVQHTTDVQKHNIESAPWSLINQGISAVYSLTLFLPRGHKCSTKVFP